MINDLLTIDSGEVLINQENIGVKTKEIISFLPERTYLESSKTVNEVFKFFQEFYQDFDRVKAEKLLKDLDLDVNAKLSKMSKGMKEKIQLKYLSDFRMKTILKHILDIISQKNEKAKKSQKQN